MPTEFSNFRQPQVQAGSNNLVVLKMSANALLYQVKLTNRLITYSFFQLVSLTRRTKHKSVIAAYFRKYQVIWNEPEVHDGTYST